MEKLVSNWSDGKILPVDYVFPPGKRPGEHVVPTSNTIPVVDLGQSSDGFYHRNIVQQIMEAAHEFGFFQVINHGVEKRLVDDARGVFKEFFELPNEEKSRFCSDDYNKKCVLYTSNVFYDKEDIHFWRDALKNICTPLEECIQYWPQKPSRYREIVGEYTVKMRELGSRILELICQGLGLEPGYFAKELSEDANLTINHYPPCPDPSLTLGAGKHCDPNLITILLQGNVPGLQVFKGGEWIGVDPISEAFVVIMGYQLQIVSNGKLKSVEHRAVTNEKEVRNSAAFFISPTKECYVEPANGVVSVANPPLYKGFHYQEFLKTYAEAHRGSIDNALQPYMHD